MRRRTLTLALLSAVLAVGAPDVAAAALSLEPVGTFASPTHVSAPPGDATRLLVAERGGRIMLVKDGAVQAQPFLDVESKVLPVGEGGFLSVAVAPDYATSGRLYVAYTVEESPAAPSDCQVTDECPPLRLEEYRRSATDPDRADPATARPILEIPHPKERNHYGGQVAFGPDGLLYLSVGDGGGAGDPDGNGQNTATLLGKLLRLDPRENGSDPYSVPSDNPFVGAAGDDLIWSYGLRNSYRFSFDRQTGALAIGEVGQVSREEVDYAPQPGGGRGANFGWDQCEGTHAFPGGGPCAFPSVAPLHDYAHDSGSPGCGGSVIGGFVVRDPTLEELEGRYLFGDFCKGWIRSLAVPTPGSPAETGLDRSTGQLVSFGEDGCGRVYVVQLDGPVSRVADETPASPCPSPSTPASSGDRSPGTRGAAAPLTLSLRLGGATRQRVLRRRYLRLRVRCDRPCSLRAFGGLSLRKRKRVGQVTRRLAGARTTTLRLRLSRAQRRAIRRALRRRRRVRARIHVRVRGDDGVLRRRSLRVRIVG